VKIVFFGTPQFAAEVLEYLLSHHIEICAVVTQPDRPKGRDLEMLPSAVKEVAHRLSPHIPILQPLKASDPQFLESLAALQADLYVVVAFGQILPQKLLDLPPLGCINVHTSLLPKYRGAAPIRSALLHGDKETGVAIQKMVYQLDAGDIIATKVLEVPDEMTFGELEKSLCDLTKPLLVQTISLFKKGIPSGAAQDHAIATYAKKIKSEEGKIDWGRPAEEIHNLVRAFSPRPGAWCWIDKKRVKILRTRKVDARGVGGEIASQGIIYCGAGALELLEVQPEGKRPMSGKDWLRGIKQFPLFAS
jgi:methionyl-tRNA formyltransferase